MTQFKVNKEVCIGCGTCVNLCPECFKIGEDGKSETLENHCDCNPQEVVSECPVRAISATKEE